MEFNAVSVAAISDTHLIARLKQGAAVDRDNLASDEIGA